MKGSWLLRTGIIGSVIAALCCFTPVLILVMSALGLSALTGYLDYVLLPALVFFIALTIVGLLYPKQTRKCKKGQHPVKY